MGTCPSLPPRPSQPLEITDEFKSAQRVFRAQTFWFPLGVALFGTLMTAVIVVWVLIL